MRFPEKAPELDGLLPVPTSAAFALAGSELDGRYLHWDELRRRTPPGGLSLEEWWGVVILKRWVLRTPLPFQDKDGTTLWFARTMSLDEGVHRIDRRLGSQLEAGEPEIATPERRDRYLIASMMEEAISSSQLEGAATTRQVAKEMLLSGRKPQDRDERMIRNNFQAMEFIRRHLDDPLSEDLVLQVHQILTEGTLQPDEVGRFRRKDELIVVQSIGDGAELHVPPDADQLKDRMAALYAFANQHAGGVFVHPFVRAALLHFMLAYEHPFVDGNGRTARALFYWSMLRQKYWLTEFLTISRVIKTAPSQYGRAFLHSETSDGDLTYFLLHQLEVVLRATDELFSYAEREEKQIRETERLLKGAGRFNHRQRAVLSQALRHPHDGVTIQAHMRAHGVVYQTARQDLLNLASEGYLAKKKRAHEFYFVAAPKLGAALKRARSATGAAVPNSTSHSGNVPAKFRS